VPECQYRPNGKQIDSLIGWIKWQNVTKEAPKNANEPIAN
jgi:hypothetical protein